MSQMPPSTLPLFDRGLLRAAARLVPAADREDWLRAWQAELWHMHHRSRRHGLRAFMSVADRSIGLTCDALWLRTDSWGRIWSGTAALCIASLLALCLLSAVIALALSGGWHSAGLQLDGQFDRSIVAAPLIVFVAFATASRRHLSPGSAIRTRFWIKRQLFFAMKIAEILALSFLLSYDLCRPVHTSLPNTADFLQILSFVLIALVGLRWAFRDQEQRCKQCLHALATAARVGRPSHNLLEWNGTELSCKQGHGLLSIPEMETSWCQSSRWVCL
jgi:hypothetical protein